MALCVAPVPDYNRESKNSTIVMKKLMMMLACVMMFVVAGAKAPEVVDVSVTGEGVGNGGRPVLVATCSAKKANKVTDDDIRRCAVRGVLFKGWADKSNTSSFDASINHPAIAGNPDVETMHADYFKDFFESGEAIKYVDVLADTRNVMKSGKLYHVSQMVTVNVQALRAKLEKDNIIKSLRSGW